MLTRRAVAVIMAAGVLAACSDSDEGRLESTLAREIERTYEIGGISVDCPGAAAAAGSEIDCTARGDFGALTERYGLPAGTNEIVFQVRFTADERFIVTGARLPAPLS